VKMIKVRGLPTPILAILKEFYLKGAI